MVFIFDLNSVVYTIIVRADYLFWITVSNLQLKWNLQVLILKFIKIWFKVDRTFGLIRNPLAK